MQDTSEKYRQEGELLQSEIEGSGKKIEEERKSISDEIKSIEEERTGIDSIQDPTAKNSAIDKFNARLTASRDRVSKFNQAIVEQSKASELKLQDYNKRADEFRKRQDAFNEEIKTAKEEQDKLDARRNLPKMTPVQGQTQIDKGAFANRYITETEKRKAALPGPMGIPSVDWSGTTPTIGEKKWKEKRADAQIIEDFNPSDPSASTQKIVVRDSNTLNKVLKENTGLDVYMSSDTGQKPRNALTNGYDPRGLNPNELQDFLAKGRAYEAQTAKTLNSERKELADAVTRGSIAPDQAKKMDDTLVQNHLKRITEGPRSPQNIRQYFRNGEITYRTALDSLREQGIGVSDSYQPRVKLPEKIDEGVFGAGQANWVNLGSPSEVRKLVTDAQAKLQDATTMANPAVDPQEYLNDALEAKSYQLQMEKAASELAKERGISQSQAEDLIFKDRTAWEKTKGFFAQVPIGITKLGTDLVQSFSWIWNEATDTAEAFGSVARMAAGEIVEGKTQDQLSVTPGTEVNLRQKLYNAMEGVNQSVSKALEDVRITEGVRDRGILEDLTGGIVSTFAYMGAAKLGASAFRLAGGSARTGGIIGGTALVGGPSQMMEAYKFGKQYGLSDKEVFGAVMQGGVLSLSEYLPFAQAVEKMNPLIRGAGYRAGLRILAQTFEEGGQELGQTALSQGINTQTVVTKLQRDALSQIPEVRANAEKQLAALAQESDAYWDNALRAGLIGAVSGGLFQGVQELAGGGRRAIKTSRLESEMTRMRMENADILNGTASVGIPNVPQGATQGQAQAIETLHAQKSAETISKVVGQDVTPKQASDINNMAGPNERSTYAQATALEKVEQQLLTKAAEEKEKIQSGTAEESAQASARHEQLLSQARGVLQQRIELLSATSQTIKTRHEASVELQGLESDPATAGVARVARVALKVASGRTDLLSEEERQLARTARANGVPAFVEENGRFRLTSEGLARLQERAPKTSQFIQVREAKPAQPTTQATKDQPQVSQAPQPKKTASGKLISPVGPKSKAGLQRKITQPASAPQALRPLDTREVAMARLVGRAVKSLIKIDLSDDTITRLASLVVKQNPDLSTSKITQVVTTFLANNGIKQAAPGMIAGKQPTQADKDAIIQQYLASGYSEAEATAWAEDIVGEFNESQNAIEASINETIQKLEQEESSRATPEISARVQVKPTQLRQLTPAESQKFASIKNTLRAFIGFEVDEDILNRLSEIMSKRSRGAISPIDIVTQFIRENNIPTIQSATPTDANALANYNRLVAQAQAALREDLSSIEASQSNHPTEQAEAQDVTDARDLVSSLATQYLGALQRTGSVVVEAQDSDTEAAESGLLFDRFKNEIVYNPKSLAGLSDEQIRLRFMEEMIHAVAWKLKLPYRTLAAQIRRDGKAEQVARFYATWITKEGEVADRADYERILNDDYQLANEYLRMVVQLAVDGKTTELAEIEVRETRPWLQAILDFLQNALLRLPEDPLLQTYVNRIKEALLSLPSNASVGIQGGRGYIETPTRASFRSFDGATQIGVRYSVVDIKDARTNTQLNTSQNRDRTSRVSRQQVENIKANFTAGRIADGAVIYSDGFRRGNPITTEGTPILDSSLNVLVGNGRLQALTELQQDGSEKYSEYKKYITDPRVAEQFGFTPEQLQQISQMEAPVLVRVLEQDFQKTEQGIQDQEIFVRTSNVSTTATLSAVEQAVSDARAMIPPQDGADPLGRLGVNEDGTTQLSKSFIDWFITNVVSPTERPQMFTPDGQLAPVAEKRMRTAILARALAPTDLQDRASLQALSDIVTGTWEGSQKVAKALESIAQQVAIYRSLQEAGERYQLDISQDILTAVRMVSEFKADAEASNAPREITEGPMLQRARIWQRSRLSFTAANQTATTLFESFASSGSPQVSAASVRKPILAYYTMANAEGNPREDAELGTGLLATERTPARTMQEIFSIAFEATQLPAQTLRSRTILSSKAIAEIAKRMRILREVRSERGLTARQQQEYENLERTMGQQFMFDGEAMGRRPEQIMLPEVTTRQPQQIDEKYVQDRLFSRRLRRTDETGNFLPGFAQTSGQGTEGTQQTAQGDVAGQAGGVRPEQGAGELGRVGPSAEVGAGGVGYGQPATTAEATGGTGVLGTYGGSTQAITGRVGASGRGVETGLGATAGGQLGSGAGLGGGAGAGAVVGGGAGTSQIAGGQVRGGPTSAGAGPLAGGQAGGLGASPIGGTPAGAGAIEGGGRGGEGAVQPASAGYRATPTRGAFEYSVENGQLTRADGSGVKQAIPATETQRRAAEKYIPVRDSLKALFDAESLGESDVASVARAKLNEVYSEFVRAYGTLNRANDPYYSGNPAIQFLNDDPEFYSVLSIESPITATQRALFDDVATLRSFTWGRGPIFESARITPNTPPTSAKTSSEAIQNSLSWNGGVVTAEYVAQQTGLAIPQAREALVSDQTIIEEIDAETAMPTGRFVPVGHFVSGNVRQKLKTAKRALDNGQQVQRHISMLKTAIPAEQPLAKMYVGPSAQWIPNDIRNRFIYEALDFNGNAFLADRYYVEERSPAPAIGEFSIYGITSARMFEHLLNGTLPVVKDNGTVNPRKTSEAVSVLKNLERKWNQWIRSGVHGQRVEGIFNSVVNAYAEPSYTFSPALPGLAVDVRRDVHQTSAVARSLLNRTSYFAHMVGAGKTFTQIITAMELKRLGLVQKNLMVVYGPTFGQFMTSIKRAYPTARVLAATKTSFSLANRKKFLEMAATQDWDIILMTHDQYDMLKPGEDSIRRFYGEQRRVLGSRRFNIPTDGGRAEGNLNRKMDRIDAKMANALDDLAKIPSHLKFDNLNVDSLFIDEAHTYKGIPIQTTRTGKGMPNRHSNIGDSNLLKTNSIHGKNGRVYLASGTPLVNSVAEAYGVIKLANPELLADAGIETFDDFISSFVRPDWTLSYTWKGTFEFEERYERFYNEKQLAGLVRQVLDIRLNPVEINLKLPALKTGTPEIIAVDETPATDAINEILRMVSNRWDEVSEDIVRGTWESRKYMMEGSEVAPSSLRRVFGWIPIVSMQLGAASSLDPRLVDPSLKDSPGSKVNTAVDKVAKIYRENPDGSILMFMDRYQPIKADTLARLRAFAEGRWDDAVPRDVEADENVEGEKDQEDAEEDKPTQPTFNLAREVIDKLAAKGVKRNEIAWINDAVDVEDLFQRVRSGEVRVIIGSTSRLGQGVDFAQRLVAMVEMDPPLQMVPSASAQRRGRIIRQSNLNERVEHIRMGLRDSMDVSIYQMLERKERSSTQFLSGGVSDMAGTPDPLAQDSPELLFGYMKASLVRDPRVIQLVEAMRDAKELRLEYEAHEAQRISTERRLRDFEEELNHTRERLAYQKDINDFLQKNPFVKQDSAGTRQFNFTHVAGGADYLQAMAGGSREIPTTGEAIKGRDQFTSAIGRTMTDHQDRLRAMNAQQLQQANFEMNAEYTLNNRFLVTFKTTIGADGRTITGHKFTLSSFYPTNNGYKRADLRSAQVVNPGDVQARIVMWATDFNEVVTKSEADLKRLTEDMSMASDRLGDQFPMMEQMLVAERKLDALQQDIASNPPARDRGPLRSRTIRRKMALKFVEGMKATSPDISVSEDNELPVNTPSYPVGSVPTSRIDMLGEFLKSDNAATTPEFRTFFGNSKVLDANGNPLVVAHGTRRADRVGNRFLKYRATSGPMPFFTDSLKLAASYSISKADTSIEDNAFEKWFYLEMNGRRVPLTTAWHYMTTEQRNKMRELAPKVTLNDEMEAVVEEGNTRGNGSYDMAIRDANGNVLSAMIDSWLNSGSVFGREGELFPSILKAAGLEDPLFYDSPELQLPAIYPVYLRIENPLDTSEIPDSVYQALEATASRRSAKQKMRGLGDNWGKDQITPKEWMQKLQYDRENNTTRAWTTIPDWVTDTLRGLGYDGVKDESGKNNPDPEYPRHAVYIPFGPTQIKSVFNVGEFGEGSNILRARKIRRRDNTPELVPNDSEANASDEARRYQSIEELRAERREAYEGVPGPQTRPDNSIPVVDIGFDPVTDQKRIAEETRGILGPEETLSMQASLSPEKIKEYIKQNGPKTSRTWLDIVLDLVGGKLDRLDHYAPGTATALLEERRSSALAATALSDLIDYMRRKVQAQFGYPKWWSLGPNKMRMKRAMAELLPVASRLEIDRMGEAGPIWKPFNQPAGVISADEMIRNGYQTGRTIVAKNGETLVIGDNLKDRYGKATEFWRLYRPMSAQRQQEVLDTYATKYPEMVGVLMEWIMPGQISKITRRGVEIPTFNRYSLHSFYNMSPFGGTSSVPGYTPDVSATGFHLASVFARLPFLGKLVSNLPMGGRVMLRPFLSGGRFTQTGVLREAGAVRNLFDGFSTRAMEIHKEIIRAKVRSQLLEASVLPSSKVDPELIGTDYIRVGAALRQMALAAAKMRAQITDLSALDPNQPELFDKNKFSKYVGQLIEEGQKFIDQDLVMRKEVYQELLTSLAEEKAEGIFTKVSLGLFKRLNAGYLALPRVAAVNLLTNEGLKLMYAMNRVIYGTMLRPIVGERDARVARREAMYVARELFGASSILKSHRAMKSEIIPMEVFREQTLVAAIMMDKDSTALDEAAKLNLGGAFLKAIKYQDIDAAQKQQLAYASYQAHAEEAWSDATRENPALTQQDKNAWKIKWAQSQPASFHEMVQKTALTYLFDYNNVPAWLDGDNAGVFKKLMQASVFPFFKFLYNLARQAVKFVPYSAYKANAINLPFKLIGYGVQKLGAKETGEKIGSFARAESTPQERADAISNLLLMAGIFGLGAAVGIGDDDEDPLIGSDFDEEGKQKDAAQRAGGRLNVSKLGRIVLAFFRMKGTPLYQKFNTDEDAYLRLRNYPYIREAMIVGNISRLLRLRAISVGNLNALSTETTEDDLKIEGPSSEGALRALIQRREAELSQELSSMLTDYATLGIAGKMVVGAVYGMSSPYDIGKATSWKIGESLIDLVSSGVAPVAARNFARDLADPIARRNRPSAALAYEGGFVDAIKNATPFLSRSLPPQGDVKTRTYDPLNPKQAVDMAGLADLGIEDSLKMFSDEKGKLKVSYPDPFAVRKQSRMAILARGIAGLNVVKVKRKKEDMENP